MQSRPPAPETLIARSVRRIVLGLVTLVALVLIVLWRIDNPRIERFRMGVADTLQPVLVWTGRPVEMVADVIENWEQFLDVYDQNRALRREIQRLQVWRETARRLEEQNAELRALNNVRLPPRITYVAGDIIADSGGPFLQSVLVNVGAGDRVEDGAAAVDGYGLVGRVVGVGNSVSRVLLLTDFSSRIPVIVRRQGRRAVVVGDGTGLPRLDFVEGSDRLRPGDLVETTGDGGVFPPDLPVGRVVATANGIWRIQPLSDLASLEFVRVLRYRPDTRIDRPGGLIIGPRLPAGDDVPSISDATGN